MMEFMGLRFNRKIAIYWALAAFLGAAVFVVMWMMGASSVALYIWALFGVAHWIGGLYAHALSTNDIQLVAKKAWVDDRLEQALSKVCTFTFLVLIPLLISMWSQGKAKGTMFWVLAAVCYLSITLRWGFWAKPAKH
jgi:hypothetical protein